MSQPTDLPNPAPTRESTQASSVGTDGNETVAVPRTVADAAPAFGPPAVAGEVGTLGPYRIVKQLGHGGMGAVYLAFDSRLKRKLALKVMLPEFVANANAKERFLREARAAAQIDHENVVTIYEADEQNGIPFIAMQYLQGYPLDEFLKHKGNPTVPQILQIARETAAGLAAAHAQGLVHRDIKPANLWLEAPHGRVKVLDFGLARPVSGESGLTRSGTVVGTPAYMSPEQGRGQKVDHRTDLFSLGTVLYRLCTGRNPFDAPSTIAILMALATEVPPSVREVNPAVPESLAELIRQLLSRQPEHRPQSAEEVVQRVQLITKQLAAGVSPPNAGRPGVAQPPVAYVPLEISAQSDNGAFANLDSTETTLADSRSAKRPPAGKGMLVLAGLALFTAIALVVGIVFSLNNKGNPVAKQDVPDEPKPGNKGTKPTPTPKQDNKLPALPVDPDQKFVEYALSIGGAVWINGDEQMIDAIGSRLRTGGRFPASIAFAFGQVITDRNAIPKEAFTITGLDLEQANVDEAGMENFKGCKSLMFLNLVDSRIKDAGLAAFAGNTNLRILNMSRMPVRDAGLVHFKDCSKLTYLDLGDTLITDVGLENFAGCQLITTLSLYATDVGNKGIAAFKNCKNLRHLVLGKTKVTDAGLDYFKDCKNLSRLIITDTATTAAKVAEVQKALPNCRIDW